MINPDPYPVSLTGDSNWGNPDRIPGIGYVSSMIPLEGYYLSGLALRLKKLYMPWMQLHTFTYDLVNPSPANMDRMANETIEYSPDCVVWLGYGNTRSNSTFFYPTVPSRRDTWEASIAVNKKISNELKPDTIKPKTAIVRFYAERALVEPGRTEWHDRFLMERVMSSLTFDLKERVDVFEYYKREDFDCNYLCSYNNVIFCIRDLDHFPFNDIIQSKVKASIFLQRS